MKNQRMRMWHVLAIGLFVASIPRATTADIVVTPPGNVSVAENGGTFFLTVTVKNNDPYRVILDFALATITPNGPDPDDTAYFSGAKGANGKPNGSLGLVNAPTSLLPGQTGLFVYSLTTSPDVPPPPIPDYGVNTFAFSIEMRKVNNNVFVPGPLPAAQGILFYNTTPGDQTPNGGVLDQLLNFQAPPLGSQLYQGGEMGVPYPATSKIQVYDTGAPAPPLLFGLPDLNPPRVPEPTSILSLGLGGLILIRSARRRRKAAPG